MCVDHIFLHRQPLFHVMDSSTCYSAAFIGPNKSLINANLVIETVWFGRISASDTVFGADFLNHGKLKSILPNAATEVKAMPPRRHSK